MLQVEGLTKRYGKVLANENVSLSVGDGVASVLAGPNGAGKSTAMKCILGLLRFEGTITVEGKPNKSEAAKRALGYVPEIPALYPMLTVEEHLEFIARAYQLRDWKELGDTLLERLEMDDKRKKLGKELSKGMQQKVSIAMAMLIRPKMLLMDEPLVGLDPHGIKTLKTLLREQREQGTAMLISTHMLETVEELWDEVYIMSAGRIAAHRTRSDIDDASETLEQLFFRITEPEGAAV